MIAILTTKSGDKNHKDTRVITHTGTHRHMHTSTHMRTAGSRAKPILKWPSPYYFSMGMPNSAPLQPFMHVQSVPAHVTGSRNVAAGAASARRRAAGVMPSLHGRTTEGTRGTAQTKEMHRRRARVHGPNTAGGNNSA